MLTQEYVKKLFNYNPETGDLIWKVSSSRNIKIEDIAGTIISDGYLQVQINKKRYLVHRIIWLWNYGVFPKNQIDHKNRDAADNRIENLRDATQSENSGNKGRSKSNTSGIKGVYWKKDCKKWRVQIQINGKKVHLGYYVKIEDAELAYKKAAIEKLGEFSGF